VSAGCGRAAVKDRYKELARLLHPDKCQVPQATEAFQKVARAYQNLSAMMA
jgi:curved DNA-binding protein CbpA